MEMHDRASQSRGYWSEDGWSYYGRVGVPREAMVRIVRRSALIMPITDARFVEKAWSRGADAVVLDLEDSVPPARKSAARALVKDAIPLVARGGSDVLVRINKPFHLAVADLDAAVWPGLTGIYFPKAEYADEIRIIDRMIAEREMARGIPVGSLQITFAVETALGLSNVQSIATASPRLVGMRLGSEDFTSDMDSEPTAEGKELFLGVMQLLAAARLAGVQPMGTLTNLGAFADVERTTRIARESRTAGFKGSSCIHPAQVLALNEGFSIPKEEVERARRIIIALEAAEAGGKDAVAVDGKMVDIPVAERARRLLARADAIARKDEQKRLAVESAGT